MIVKSVMGEDGGEYPWDWVLKIPYKDIDDGKDDKILFLGWGILNDKYADIKNKYQYIKKKYFINFASPCEIYDDNFLNILNKQNYFDKIFTICPLTLDYLKKYYFIEKFIAIPHPIPNEYLRQFNYIPIEKKIYDVMFYGGINSEEHHNIIRCFSGFKSCVVSYHRRNYFRWPLFINFFKSVTLEKKWNLLAQSKILVGTNLLYLNDKEIFNLAKQDNFKFFPYSDIVLKNKILPQMKSRMLEAAATKTLMLLKKDNWNIIETWFKPDVDFIYWDNYSDLKDKISEISKNFHKYQHILENALLTSKKYYFDEFSKKL
jgi:hypothetical protein